MGLDALSRYLKSVKERADWCGDNFYADYQSLLEADSEALQVAVADISTLLEMLRVAIEALDKVSRDELAHPWVYVRNALDKVTALCPEGE